MDLVLLAWLGVLTGTLVLLLAASIRVVPEHERLVVFRLGRTAPQLVRGPGLVFLLPVLDRPIAVDLREQSTRVEATGTASDHEPIEVDLSVTWRIVDPYRSVVTVAGFADALRNVAASTIRDVLRTRGADEAIFDRGRLAEDVRVPLGTAIERWGGAVTAVAVRRTTPR